MSVPADRKYSESHEWYQVDGNVVTIGITQFAADELTDITYVELPEVGATVQSGKACAEIESVKATAELLCAVSGQVRAVNDGLIDNPERLNDDPFGAGWIVKIEMSEAAPLDLLMDAAAYQKMIAAS